MKKKGVRNIVKCIGEITVLTDYITTLRCDQTGPGVAVFSEPMFRRINLISKKMRLVNMNDYFENFGKIISKEMGL